MGPRGVPAVLKAEGGDQGAAQPRLAVPREGFELRRALQSGRGRLGLAVPHEWLPRRLDAYGASSPSTRTELMAACRAALDEDFSLEGP